MKRLAFALLFASLGAAVFATQPKVYFVNVYPGHDIYELEGHTAIVVDYGEGNEVAFNYGVFDFDSPNFVYRFVKGETDYMLAAYPAHYFYQSYVPARRRTVAHELNLDSLQTQRLINALNVNLLPQNRTYRYNYVKDNCATRPLRMVELAAGDSIILGPAPFEAQSLRWPTFRNVMRHYHTNYPWYQFGIDLALGSGIDYRISRREIAFAPVELDGMMAGATVGGKPLVKRSKVVNDFEPFEAVRPATPWYLTPMAVALLIFGIAVILTGIDLHRRRPCRIFDAIFFGLLGIVGCVITFLIFISVHEATSPNWLFVWLNPLLLLVPVLLWVPRAHPVLRVYSLLCAVATGLLLLCWPFLPQSANPAFFPLLMATCLRAATEWRYLK